MSETRTPEDLRPQRSAALRLAGGALLAAIALLIAALLLEQDTGLGEVGRSDFGGPPAPVAASVPSPQAGYRIELDVAGKPEQLAALQQQLAASGLPATLQIRVVLGPFADRDAARNAQAALRASGLDAGMLVPPAANTP